MDPFGIGTTLTQISLAIPPAVRAILPGRGPSEDPPNPELSPDAIAALDDLLTCSLRIIGQLQTVAQLGVPPSIVGAAWTWPVMFRAVRAITPLCTELVAAFTRVSLHAPEADVEQAANLCTAVAAACGAFADAPKRSARPFADDVGVARARDAAIAQCRDIVLRVRSAKGLDGWAAAAIHTEGVGGENEGDCVVATEAETDEGPFRG